MNNESMIEALLFSRAEPWDTEELAKILKLSPEEIKISLTNLSSTLTGRGISLVETGTKVTLGTSKEASGLLEQLYKEDLEKNLSKASIETLSIIMYGTEVTRPKIDYIRGVNSSFILRSLLIRGLIERVTKPLDKKTFMYVPTPELLSFMGATSVKDLKDYEKINGELTKSFAKSDITYDNDTPSTETPSS